MYVCIYTYLCVYVCVYICIYVYAYRDDAAAVIGHDIAPDEMRRCFPDVAATPKKVIQ